MEKLEKKIEEIQLSHLRLNSGGNISLRSIEDSGLQIASEVKDIAIAFARFRENYIDVMECDPDRVSYTVDNNKLFNAFITNYYK